MIEIWVDLDLMQLAEQDRMILKKVCFSVVVILFFCRCDTVFLSL